jgi:hypothetical protein
MILIHILRAKYKILINIVLIISFLYSTKNCWVFNGTPQSFGCMIPLFYLGGGAMLSAIGVNLYWGYSIFKSNKSNVDSFQRWLLFGFILIWLILFFFTRLMMK